MTSAPKAHRFFHWQARYRRNFPGNTIGKGSSLDSLPRAIRLDTPASALAAEVRASSRDRCVARQLATIWNGRPVTRYPLSEAPTQQPPSRSTTQ